MAGAAEPAADDGPPAGANGDGTSGVLAGAGRAAELGGGGGGVELLENVSGAGGGGGGGGVELLEEVCGAGGGGGGGDGGEGGAALVGARATGVTVGVGATARFDLGVAEATGACSWPSPI